MAEKDLKLTPVASSTIIEHRFEGEGSQDIDSRFSVDSNLIFSHGVSLDAAHKNLGGAPIEDESPMGREIGWWSIVLLSLSSMIGTGIFSTPATLLKASGSIGLALIYWVVGFLIAVSGFAYYIELGAMFPDRAGAEVAYYEQIYKHPRFLSTATWAAFCIFLNFNSSNCIVFAQYVMYSYDTTLNDEWIMRGIAIAAYAVVCLLITCSTRWSLWVSNLLSIVKVGTLLFIVVAGWVVLGGHTRVKDSHSHFHNPFGGTSSNGNDQANALINVFFTYSGWNLVNSLTNEIKGDKVRSLKTAGNTSIFLVFFLYFFANIAYFAAVPIEEAKESGQLIAAVFFQKVFGDYAGTRVLPVFIALSSFGNLISITISQARGIREIARQGVIPFSAFFSSTKPFNTPAAALLIKFVTTVIVIIGPPAGDAFNFLVSLQSYPFTIFDILLVVGVWILRRRRRIGGEGPAEYQAWNVALIFSIAIRVLIVVMAWVPPTTGAYGGNVSFWYATAPAVGLGIIALCFIYWYVWARALPTLFNYTICEEISKGANGELSKRFVRVYNDHRGDQFRKQQTETAADPASPTDFTSDEKSTSKDIEGGVPRVSVQLAAH